jgi:hypothetical protein
MRTEELAEAMDRTMAVPPVDIDAITRRGRRLVVRRRLVGGALALACAAAVVVPVAVVTTAGGHDSATPAVGRQDGFVRARPLGAVADTGDKFYWGRPHAAALGPEAIWVEAGDPAYRISFGFHDEQSRALMLAGSMAVPDVRGDRVPLPAIPRQEEPTYVGMVPIPAGVDGAKMSAGVESAPPDVVTAVTHSLTVRPGYFVFWVTAAADLTRARYSVQDGAGHFLARGGFRPAAEG